MVVVCPFITQHKAPTIIHSLLCQTADRSHFVHSDFFFFMWTCSDKDIKLFYLNETNRTTERKKKIAYTHKFTASITHRNKAVSTNDGKLSKK